MYTNMFHLFRSFICYYHQEMGLKKLEIHLNKFSVSRCWIQWVYGWSRSLWYADVIVLEVGIGNKALVP